MYRCIQSLGPLKALSNMPPGRPVYSKTNSTSLGSIQPIVIAVQRLFTYPPLSSTHLDNLK